MSVVKLTASMEQDGYFWSRQLAGPEKVAALRSALMTMIPDSSRAGVRQLLRGCPAVAEFAGSKAVVELIRQFLGHQPFTVRGILFDKTPESNWLVAWHQDVTIAVREQKPTHGFGPWSVKDGIPHAHAPVELLERMVTLRLHLDDCDETNGALRVVAGSHRHGKMDAKAIAEWKARGQIEECTAQAGDALLMRPLLLHASSPASTPQHRRVVHLEFAAEELPEGLAWAERISA